MNTTQENIIELGRDFIQQVGYHSFNYKQIATALNIKNAAVHHYYPAKEDLGVAVIERDKADFMSMVKATENATPTEKTEAILNSYDQYFKDGHKLCVIGTCGSAFSSIPEKMQAATKDYLDIITDWLTDTFKKGLESREFSFKADPADIASEWITTLPGTLITGRIKGERYFQNAQSLLRKSLQKN